MEELQQKSAYQGGRVGDFDSRQKGEKEAWDEFLANHAWGQHVQSSMWGDLKTLHGWQPHRIILKENGRIVAGAQILLRDISIIGKVGYISKGPVFAYAGLKLYRRFFNHLIRAAKANKARLVLMQPVQNDARFLEFIHDEGLLESDFELAPRATVRVPLQPPIEDILKGMKSHTRYQFRKGERRGLTARMAGKEELKTFYRLLEQTARRQDFSPYPLAYFEEMWGAFEKNGQIQLIFVDYENEPVCAQLMIAFGNTVVAKNCGWTGEHRKLSPMYFMDWESIKWAKENGFAYYDFEGIKPEAAAELKAGRPLPEKFHQTPTFYKLRFGGEVLLLPSAYEFVPNAFLRFCYKSLQPVLANSSLAIKLRRRFAQG